MTCIVGIVYEGEVWIGADSAAVDLNSGVVRYHGQGKVFQVGEFLMGYSTSFRMGEVLRYHLNVPIHDRSKDNLNYISTSFAEAVRHCLKTYGMATVENNVETGGRLIVGYRGGLYLVDVDYHVSVPREDYDAIGSGDLAALGSLYSTKEMQVNPQKRVLIALQAAECHSTHVRGPFMVKRLDPTLLGLSSVV
jgi:20S proteasome alpha/beta subunit